VSQEIQTRLKRLRRRDWWLWFTSALVILLLTVAVVSFTMPTLFQDQTGFFQFNLEQAVRGLVGMVLIFNVYAIYQHWVMKRLQQQLEQQLEETARLETRAELLEKLAKLDPLTGLHNRRVAEERLHAEVSRSRRYGRPLTLISFDLDDFKRINDLYGHAAGDEVLKAFARRLSEVTRPSDVAVRMGGDEFLLILPECIESYAGHIIERIGTTVVEWRGQPLVVKFSAGWSGYRAGDTAEQLLERADQMLYCNKRDRPRATLETAAS
jgi:diguanylate cyclase (GGDEF)-like protein